MLYWRNIEKNSFLLLRFGHKLTACQAITSGSHNLSRSKSAAAASVNIIYRVCQNVIVNMISLLFLDLLPYTLLFPWHTTPQPFLKFKLELLTIWILSYLVKVMKLLHQTECALCEKKHWRFYVLCFVKMNINTQYWSVINEQWEPDTIQKHLNRLKFGNVQVSNEGWSNWRHTLQL